MDETHVTHATPTNDNTFVATFICDICETHFQNKEDVTKHKTKEYENADYNVFTCTEGQEDFDSYEMITNHNIKK